MRSEIKSIKVDKESKTVTIVCSLIEEVSSTGKSVNIVSTGGFTSTGEHYKYKGSAHPIRANINIGIPNPDR